jgi:GST-like protein
MATYALYGTKRAGSAAIELALRRCDIPYRLVNAASWKPQSALGELAEANPLHQIPTLVLPNGQVLTESAAILIYLGLTNPKSGLLARRAAPRAQQIRGLVFIAANCYSAISINDYPGRWTTTTSEAERLKVSEGACRQLHRNWENFADTFPTNPYLTGRQPGALDYLAVVVTKWASTRSHLAKTRPRFRKTLLSIEEHESAVEVFKEHWGK